MSGITTRYVLLNPEDGNECMLACVIGPPPPISDVPIYIGSSFANGRYIVNRIAWEVRPDRLDIFGNATTAVVYVFDDDAF